MKVAVVGCGGIGMAHARAYGQIEAAELAFMVDKNEALAKEKAGEVGCAPLCDIANIPDDVQCVSVATPPSVHYPLVKALLEKGHHVFSEKPLTMDIDKAAELVRLAARCNRCLGVGFKMRHEPIFVKAKALVERVGRIQLISTFKQQPYRPREGWDWVPEVGAMYELSVHDFDLVHAICGVAPRAVLSARLDHSYGWPRENAFAITVEYDNGAIGSLCGMYAKEGKWTGRDFTLTILGEHGYLQVERNDRIVFHGEEVEIFPKPEDVPNTFALELSDFLAAIDAGERPPVDGLCGYYTTALVELAVRAHEEGRRQDIDRQAVEA